MPAAAVVFYQAVRDGMIYGATGQHAHGFCLKSWSGKDQTAAAPERGSDIAEADRAGSLHDDRALRQFTISPLLGLAKVRHGVTHVAAGDIARLRLTALDDHGQADLLRDWLPRLRDPATIGGVEWVKLGEAVNPADHAAAGAATYAALRDRYRNGAAVPTRWRVAFESPMAFHQDDRILPFPLPERLVSSWLKRWNEYSPLSLIDPGDPVAGFLARAETGLRVSAYRLKTVSFRFRHPGPGGRRTTEVPQIGCVGELALDGAGLAEDDRAVVSSLVDFAFYCGSGHHTAMGMGQTRVVGSDSSRPPHP
jgi:CRISPR-associated endoribonuclease Cas6